MNELEMCYGARASNHWSKTLLVVKTIDGRFGCTNKQLDQIARLFETNTNNRAMVEIVSQIVVEANATTKGMLN